MDRAPLTPAECDLRGLPWMPLDTVRLLDSDLFAVASGEVFKAAVALWCKAWQQVPAASLPDDDRVLAHLSGAGGRWRKIKGEALRGFVRCSDGRLYHPVIAEKALEAWAHRRAQRERAAKRWHPEGDARAHATAHAAASATAMQGTGTGTRKETPSAGRQADAALRDGFDAFWKMYPQRQNNPRSRAFRAYAAAVADGHSIEQLLASADRYARYCRAKGIEGSEHVLQAATFLGSTDKRFLEPWEVRDAGAQWWSSNEAITKKGGELGLSARRGESWPEFRARIHAEIERRRTPKPSAEVRA